MGHHLALLYRTFINDIIEGRKTLEARFGEMEQLPYKIVKPGDLIWLKQVGGPVRAVATARSVRYLDNLTPYLIKLIRKEWNGIIRAPATFWHSHRNASYGSLIWLGEVCPLKPFNVEKKDRRSWVSLPGPLKPGETI